MNKVFLPTQANISWMEFASCAGKSARDGNYNTFFPEAPPRFTPDTSEALAICAGCSVHVECLDYALYYRITEGVFGGKTANQRKYILREQRRLQGDPDFQQDVAVIANAIEQEWAYEEAM